MKGMKKDDFINICSKLFDNMNGLNMIWSGE